MNKIGNFDLHESDDKIDFHVKIEDDIFNSGIAIVLNYGNYNFYNEITLCEKDFKKLMTILKKIEKKIKND